MFVNVHENEQNTTFGIVARVPGAEEGIGIDVVRWIAIDAFFNACCGKSARTV